jgi:hypothetical protein
MKILIWVVVTLAKFTQKSQELNQKLGRKEADFEQKVLINSIKP